MLCARGTDFTLPKRSQHIPRETRPRRGTSQTAPQRLSVWGNPPEPRSGASALPDCRAWGSLAPRWAGRARGTARSVQPGRTSACTQSSELFIPQQIRRPRRGSLKSMELAYRQLPSVQGLCLNEGMGGPAGRTGTCPRSVLL